MTRLLSILTFFLFVSLQIHANIRRVGFTDISPVAGIDYATCYAAHQAANNGDTILIFPGKTISSGWLENLGDVQISKKLIFISKGYWLDTASSPKGNFGLQAVPVTGLLGSTIRLFPSSNGSVIMGFDLQGGVIDVRANDIVIKRNYNFNVFLGNTSASNLLIEGNYKVGISGDNNSAQVWSNLILRNNLISQLWQMPTKTYTGVISNNTFAYTNTSAAGVNGGNNSMSSPVTGNFFDNDIYLYGGFWTFENNLLVTLTNNDSALNLGYDIIGSQNTVFNNNVAIKASNFTAWPASAGIGNIVLTPTQVPDIFEAFPAIGASSADGRYRLKPGSPALALSSARPTSLIDAGMYDGLTPYKLGMIPSIPSIYNISSPQGNSPTGNTLQINLSIRSNN